MLSSVHQPRRFCLNSPCVQLPCPAFTPQGDQQQTSDIRSKPLIHLPIMHFRATALTLLASAVSLVSAQTYSGDGKHLNSLKLRDFVADSAPRNVLCTRFVRLL